LEEAPTAMASLTQRQLPDRSGHLMVLSASSAPALRDLSLAYAEHLAKEPECSLPDICHTAAIGRSALPYRLAFPAPNIAVARELLNSFAHGGSNPEIVSGRIRSDSRVAFLFTGQGAQHTGMGRALYVAEPVFRVAFDQCALLLGKYLDRPLREIVGYEADSSAPPDILDETRYTQPALFAVEYALASLWRSWGIEPAAIVGHSLGEYVGACVAGALSLEDALRLVAARSRLMQSLPRNGAMAAVFAGEQRVRAMVAPYNDSVSIAATNSPVNTVISGKADDVRAVLQRLRREGMESKPLTVSHAFHSPLVEPVLDEFEQSARSVEHRVPAVDLVLNLTARPLGESLPLDANYWRRHARETVRFAESVRNLHARGIRAFLEIGPAPVLIAMARQCVEDSETTWLASLCKERDTWPQMLSSLGALFVLGAKPDWGAYDRPYRRRRVALPTYPFQRERHWLPVASTNSAHKRTQAAGHSLLGIHAPLASRPELLESVEDWLYEPKWEIKEPTGELSPEISMTGIWIIFRDQQGIGEAICAQLRERGATCLCVDHGEQQRSRADDSLMTVRPDNTDDYDELLRAAARQDSVVNRIVHLWSLDAADPEKADLKAVQEAQTFGPVSVLHLVQALDRAQLSASPKLWLVSWGAQPVGENPGPLSVLQSPLWGLGRTIAMENADFWGGSGLRHGKRSRWIRNSVCCSR
jgi:acyl transferase domain-containing protein